MAGLMPDGIILPPGYGVGSEPAMQGPDQGLPVDVPMEMPEPLPPGATELPDGSLTFDFGPPPTGREAAEHNDNLAELISEEDLAKIAEDLLQGIQADEDSRQEWLSTRAKGMELLALKIEKPGESSESAVEGQSVVRHPMLLEAVVRFQANARAELLPTDGPVKVRNDDPTVELEDNPVAEALAKDMNHFLTVTATEYYPDTDRMLFKLAFGGSEFRKGYHCPLRRRPVLETVDARNLIVAEGTTDLTNAARVTHRIPDMRHSTLKRMQIAGAYRNIDLGQPADPEDNAVDSAIASQQGVHTAARRPEDTPHEILECYCELDLPGFEHLDADKQETGLPLPYKVTIEKTSRKILEIRRNWRADDPDYRPRKVFVHFPFVPGFGFYAYGLLHLMGNITQAATASWRQMLDAGAFANFPGLLAARSGAKQPTNVIRVPPGGMAYVDVPGGMKLSDAVMPLPYKEAGPGMMALAENLVQTGQRVGGTADIQVGEGRQDAPVGTTLALIEQATKPLSAVHKRLYTAQAEELQLLCDLLREDPQALWRGNKRPRMQQDTELLVKALSDTDLVPVADPNTASHMERVMKAVALEQLASNHPDLYDERAVQTLILQMVNIGSPDQLFRQVDPNEPPPPEVMQAMEELKLKDREVAVKEGELQLKAAESQQKQGLAAMELQAGQTEAQARMAEAQTKIELAGHKARGEAAKAGAAEQQAGLAALDLRMKARDSERKHELERQKLAAQTGVAAMQQRAETQRHADQLATQLHINRTDNETALEITDKEIASSEKVAAENRKAAVAKAKATGGKTNMKNGNGINPKKR